MGHAVQLYFDAKLQAAFTRFGSAHERDAAHGKIRAHPVVRHIHLRR